MKRELLSKINDKLTFLQVNRERIGKSEEELQRVDGEMAVLRYIIENKPSKEFIEGMMLGCQKVLEILEKKK
ncbi:MAG: hypothetical protein QXF56_05445 [Candidatus Micrarchaeia archaeon]